MNFGYLLFVSTSDQANYLSMAYALAISIKNTQKPGFDQVALVIDNKKELSKLKSPWVFDHVIEWDQETFWNGRSWMDQLTPFDATVCLDADMLFLNDCSHWVEYFLENSEMYLANTAYTYRGELIDDSSYRQAFIKNNLPNLYSFYTFFKKHSDVATEFFTLNRYIVKHATEFSNTFLSKHKPKIMGTDEAFALSANILGITDQIAYDLSFPRVVHFKGMIQNWPWPAEKCTDHVGFYLNQLGELKIGNYQQRDLFHYVEKDLMTQEYISNLEKILWKN